MQYSQITEEEFNSTPVVFQEKYNRIKDGLGKFVIYGELHGDMRMFYISSAECVVSEKSVCSIRIKGTSLAKFDDDSFDEYEVHHDDVMIVAVWSSENRFYKDNLTYFKIASFDDIDWKSFAKELFNIK